MGSVRCGCAGGCRKRQCGRDRRCRRQALEGGVPVHEGGELERGDVRPAGRCCGPDRLREGHRQDDRHGRPDGSQAAEGGWGGPRLGHVKAIEGMDSKGVLTQSDFTAINAGLGKVFASVPTSKVMDVYNAVGGVVGSSGVPNKLLSTVDANAANAAYNGLMEFKDVVKAASAQR